MTRSIRGAAALCLVLTAVLLAGCTAVVVGGAAAVGAVVATDRRSLATQASDQSIEFRATSRINEALGEQRGHVIITSYFRKVLVTGEVASAELRQRAQEVIAGTPEVAEVVNELAVMPESPLSQRSSDSLLTGRVKARLLDANGVPANSIKVVTERGTVYLMGRLTQREIDLATEVVRTTPDVQRVVRLLDRISEQSALHPNDPAGRPPAPAPVSSPASASAAPAGGATAHPVVDPVVIQQPPVEVRPLPPVR